MAQKLKAYFTLIRPHQYIKNSFVLLPLFFGHKLNDFQAIIFSLYAFFAFCLAASSVYVLNDLKDIAEDRQHTVKKYRPLASGLIRRTEAVILYIVILSAALAVSYAIHDKRLMMILGGYLVLNGAYSFLLKHHAVIDVVCIAAGFVLRVFAGGTASDVEISPWIVIMTFLLGVFLALAKRRDDLLQAQNGQVTRKSLDGYNIEFVSLSMIVMASVIIVAYILYTVSPDIVTKHGTNHLYLTGFWVVVGILRYMQITFVEGKSGSPTLVLLKDFVLQAIILLWLLSFFLLVYGDGIRW